MTAKLRSKPAELQQPTPVAAADLSAAEARTLAVRASIGNGNADSALDLSTCSSPCAQSRSATFDGTAIDTGTAQAAAAEAGLCDRRSLLPDVETSQSMTGHSRFRVASSSFRVVSNSHFHVAQHRIMAGPR